MRFQTPFSSRLLGSALCALVAAAVISGSTNTACAATITAKGGNAFLNRKQSWIGNKVPTAFDIALWNNATTGATTAALGSNMSWRGIQILNPGGAVTFNAGSTLTLGSSGIDMSAATVNFTIHCAVSLSVAQTWSVNSTRALAANGIISGSGGITKTGLGTLTLSGANTYMGSTTITAGTLAVSTATALGSGSGALTIGAGAILQGNGTFSTSRMVTLGGSGGAASGGTFEVTGAFSQTRTGVISGSGSLIKTGTGTLILSAANTYSGDTYIMGGTLSIANGQALGPQPTLGSGLYGIHMANGTTLVANTGISAGARQLELISGTATSEVIAGVSHQRNGLIYGAGGLIKAGTGTEILTNANTYSGGTTIAAGTLQVNNSAGSGTGTGAVTVNSGGTLSGLPTAAGFTTGGTISGHVTVNNGGALLARSGTTFTFGGLTLNASARSNLQLGAPTETALINITGSNAFSLAGASVINLSNIGGVSAGTYRLFDYNGTALPSLANLQLGSTPGGGFTYSLSNNQTSTSVDLIVSATDVQWANDANGLWSADANWTNGAEPNAAGDQANFFRLIHADRTVTVDGAFTVGTMSFDNAFAYTLAASGNAAHKLTFDNGGTASISAGSGSHNVAAPVALANDLTLSAKAGSALTISGALSENTAGRVITSDGAGTITLSGASANTYTGLTVVNAGTLQFNKSSGVNAIGSGGLRVSSGATASWLASNQIADAAGVVANGTLNLGAFSEVVGALSGTGTVTTATGGILTVGASNALSSQFDGTITGGGTLRKAGGGTFTLSGTNTFGGAGQTVSVNAGTLRVNGDANLGNLANSVTFNGGTLALTAGFTSNRAFNLPANATIDTAINTASLSGLISGAGGLTKNGTGTMTISGANTYSGGTTINGGSVVVNSASSLGAANGALGLNAGTLQVASGFNSSRNIVLGDASSTIQVDADQTFTANGVLSGSGSLNKSGAGTLTVTGPNTLTGITAVNAGALTVLHSSGTGLSSSSKIEVNSGGTLLLGASNQIGNAVPVTLGGGTISKGNFSEGSESSAGFGALTLTADSRLDFGTARGVLTFASFTPDENLLVIDNWSGIANSVGTASTDRLIFSSSQSANLAFFSFTGYNAGATQFNLSGGYYEVVPVTAVPEPGTYVVGLLAVAVIAYRQRHRLIRKRSA